MKRDLSGAFEPHNRWYNIKIRKWSLIMIFIFHFIDLVNYFKRLDFYEVRFIQGNPILLYCYSGVPTYGAFYRKSMTYLYTNTLKRVQLMGLFSKKLRP